jgi:LPXTG-motif cell wall-anchored protein
MHSGGSGTGGISFQVTDGTAGTCSYVMAMVSVSAAGTCVVTVTKAASGIYAEVSSSPTTITFVDPPAPSTTTTTQAPTTTTTEVPPTSTTVVITEEDVFALPVTEFAPDLTTIAPGQPVRLTVGGFVPGELVDLYVASTPTYLGSGIADENGFVTIEGVIPDDLEGGSHSLVLLAPVSGIGFRQEVTLETTENVGGLPTTGSEAAPLVAFGVLIALLGAGLTIVARRRRVI